MKRLILLLAIYFVAAACEKERDQGGALWKKIGLDGKTINEIRLTQSKFYVATTSGLYAKDIEEENFASIGFEGQNVEAIEILHDDIILASIFDKSGTVQPSLHNSSDFGATWYKLDHNFGGTQDEPVFDLEYDSENGLLYASGYDVIARSQNGGQSWTMIYGDWGGFATGISVVEVHPSRKEDIWAGGQGAIENGFLISKSFGPDWERWTGLLPDPTVVKEISFGADADEIFVGWEGGLTRTNDNGSSWETLINSEEDNRFFFGVARSNAVPTRIYAGGWLKTSGAQPLILFISDDNGETWEEYRMPRETYGGILEMQLMEGEGEDRVLLGLDRGGVYEVIIQH